MWHDLRAHLCMSKPSASSATGTDRRDTTERWPLFVTGGESSAWLQVLYGLGFAAHLDYDQHDWYFVQHRHAPGSDAVLELFGVKWPPETTTQNSTAETPTAPRVTPEPSTNPEVPKLNLAAMAATTPPAPTLTSRRTNRTHRPDAPVSPRPPPAESATFPATRIDRVAAVPVRGEVLQSLQRSEYFQHGLDEIAQICINVLLCAYNMRPNDMNRESCTLVLDQVQLQEEIDFRMAAKILHENDLDKVDTIWDTDKFEEMFGLYVHSEISPAQLRNRVESMQVRKGTPPVNTKAQKEIDTLRAQIETMQASNNRDEVIISLNAEKERNEKLLHKIEAIESQKLDEKRSNETATKTLRSKLTEKKSRISSLEREVKEQQEAKAQLEKTFVEVQAQHETLFRTLEDELAAKADEEALMHEMHAELEQLQRENAQIRVEEAALQQKLEDSTRVSKEALRERQERIDRLEEEKKTCVDDNQLVRELFRSVEDRAREASKELQEVQRQKDDDAVKELEEQIQRLKDEAKERENTLKEIEQEHKHDMEKQEQATREARVRLAEEEERSRQEQEQVVSEMEASQKEHKQMVSEIEAELNKAKQRQKETEEELNNVRQKQAEMEITKKEQEHMATDMKNAQEEQERIQAEMKASQKRQVEMEVELEEAKQKQVEIQAQAKRTQRETEENMTLEIDSALQQVHDLQKKLAAMEVDYAKMQRLRIQVQQIERDLHNEQVKNQDLTKQMKDQTSNQNRLEQITKEHAELTRKYEELKGELKQTNTTLQQAYLQQGKEQKEYQKEINFRKQAVQERDDLQKDIITYQQNNSRLQQENENLQRQLKLRETELSDGMQQIETTLQRLEHEKLKLSQIQARYQHEDQEHIDQLEQQHLKLNPEEVNELEKNLKTLTKDEDALVQLGKELEEAMQQKDVPMPDRVMLQSKSTTRPYKSRAPKHIQTKTQHGSYPDTVTWHPLPPQQALPWHYTHMYVPVSYSML